MLFDRRHKLTKLQTLIGWLWPRSGFARGGAYIWHRVARLPGTSHAIAAGFASGAAVSFTPFLGVHFLLGFAVAWATRGNMVAAAIGTAIGNPWTFPFIFALTGHIGSAVLGQDVAPDVPVWDWNALFQAPFEYVSAFFPIVSPLLVGGIPTAIAVWVLFYFALKAMVVRYRKRRQRRMEAKSLEMDLLDRPVASRENKEIYDE
ncbi:MAG: DUF2062 domain-containing protein [Kordiimonadaceae bacterium]|nr:DUF2062 domain-containing protein [Kordiimonadaceae bacterium]